MIKQYFTDGLIQIAIILSLLRTDLNNWHLHNNYMNYPEVQDIILGQSQAYTTTNFHNQYNTFNSLGGGVHPKSIDNDFASAIFRDLRSLSRFRRFDGIATEVNAFLVSETAFGLPASAASGQVESHPSEDSNNNLAHPAIPTQSTSASVVQDNVDNQPTSDNVCPVDDEPHEDDNVGAVGLPPTSVPGSEPTDEDLDLIEVLWRQDIDLGVGKDAFDVNLRRELERDREVELQKKREKQKELELLRQKVEEEKRQQQQQWIQQNFTQDGETGEWIPLNADALVTPPLDITQPLDNALSLEDALDILNAETGTFVNTDYTPVPENSPQLPLPPQPHLSPTVPSMDSYLLDANHYNNQSVQHPSSNLNRQDSLDQQWDDLVSFLDLVGVNESQLASVNSSQLAGMNSSQLNMNAVNSAAQMNITNMNTPQMNVASMISMNSEVNTTNTVTSQPLPSPCVNGSVLLQNATLPPPVANVSMPAVVNTTNMSPINSTGFLSPPADFNSSVPNTTTIQGTLDWEASDMLFSNVTVNQTDTALEDVDGILPDFLPEDELDMAINEGLQTMQMLDEASSDSAVSMGSASPMQEMSDSGAMSPYDGLEGATGGSDYGSPSYSKASKYDPEEYRYGYTSCSYSHSDSSQTNYSTSSNDTDVNKPHGGNNHINHNHTYPLKPGASPKEIKTSTKTDKLKMKGPHTRDVKRAQELKVPFSVDQIIESPVEEFNEMITKYKLTEPQIQLIRDIRRRGKNKVAAQNCRKRKLDVVVTLEDEMNNLQDMKEQLLKERQQIDKQTREMKEKFSHMYQEIFRSLRDEHGHPYDPNEYSLQQSSDGNVFLVPRNISADDQQMNGKKRKNEK